MLDWLSRWWLMIPAAILAAGWWAMQFDQGRRLLSVLFG